jgi:hypothetical protein
MTNVIVGTRKDGLLDENIFASNEMSEIEDIFDKLVSIGGEVYSDHTILCDVSDDVVDELSQNAHKNITTISNRAIQLAYEIGESLREKRELGTTEAAAEADAIVEHLTQILDDNQAAVDSVRHITNTDDNQ